MRHPQQQTLHVSATGRYPMHKLTTSQTTILRLLLHTESWQNLLDESGLAPGVLRDDLIMLSHKQFIEAFEHENGAPGTKVRHFDNDFPERFHYRATSAGIRAVSGAG